MPCCRQPLSATYVLLLLASCLACACDRREQGVEGDLSPETGLTTPAPHETPPSDPASGSATTPADDTTGDDHTEGDAAADTADRERSDAGR